MTSNPSTYRGNSDGPSGIDWDDGAELHKQDDGGGVLGRFKTIRRGTLAELIAYVMRLPEDEQPLYSIQKAGDHRLEIEEIRSLFRNPAFPGASGS